jgi:hypothetical protein
MLLIISNRFKCGHGVSERKRTQANASERKRTQANACASPGRKIDSLANLHTYDAAKIVFTSFAFAITPFPFAVAPFA